MRPIRTLIVGIIFAAGVLPGPAFAHTTERAFVLVLPTELYLTGGTLAVALSFVLMVLMPVADPRALEAMTWRVGRLPAGLSNALSLVSLAVLAALILAGWFGTQDPLANPLPLAVWTLGWIGLTFAHAVLGNLWAALNPWRGVCGLLFRLPGLARWRGRPPLAYPEWLGYWPAVLQFLAFAWFELIYTVPQNPEFLAQAVALYVALNLALALLFGPAVWLRFGEAFSVLFRFLSWLSPFGGRPAQEDEIFATLPGLGLLRAPALPPSGVAFVLLALASVSFDGLARSYWWLGGMGVNPLDFPGRSALAAVNTLGLLGGFAALIAGYGAAVWLGWRLTGRPGRFSAACGAYAISILPIALGYHFAHYLTVFLVDVQYAAIAFNDPLGRGWDLFGLHGAHATTSFLYDFDSVRKIWHVQVATIVIAHVVAIATAHGIALSRSDTRGTAILGQIPLTLLMIAYTLFGLWLLSTPAIG
jgi:hypothetical protein